MREREAVQTRDEISFGKEEEEKTQINEGQSWPEPPKRKKKRRKPQEPDLHDRQKNRCRLPEEPPADIHVPWKPSYKEKVEDVKKKEADNEEA